MKTKFTKGDWIVEDGKAVLCNGHKVAYVNSGDNIPYFENIKANAHLIAAAPEMYEALEQVMKTLSSDGFGCFDNTCAEIGKLLAKARGEHE